MKRGQVIGVDSDFVAMIDCPLAKNVVTVQCAKVQRVDPQLIAMIDCPPAKDMIAVQRPKVERIDPQLVCNQSSRLLEYLGRINAR